MHKDKKNIQISELIHDAHEILADGYGDLDDQGLVPQNTLEDWNYKTNVRLPIAGLVARHLHHRPFVMLDAGCGNGQLLHLYSELGAKLIYGVDFGWSMLKLAKARARNNRISFVPLQASLEGLACIKHKSFDLINLYGVLEHLPDPVVVLKALEKLLAPHGILIIAVPRKWSLAWLSYFLFCPSLARYAGQETRLDRLLRRKKMQLYKFYTRADMQDILAHLESLQLLETVPIAHGGVVGLVDRPLRKLAQKGNYRTIDCWNSLCKHIRFAPAGEYWVLGRP